MDIVSYVVADWPVLIGVPVIGGLIGWITNYVAVKMLFHPREPWKIFGFEVQGVFPKRQKAFAEKLGTMVSQQLLSTADVIATLDQAAESERVHAVVSRHLEEAITQKLPQVIPMVSMILSPELVATVKGALLKDLSQLLRELTQEIGNHLEDVLDIRRLVEEKVANFSSDRLEELVFSIMKRELRFIEYIGGVLGFLIGVVQVIIVKISPGL